MIQTEKKIIYASIDGIHCTSCVNRIEQTLSPLPGLMGIQINLASKEGRFEVDSNLITQEKIKTALEKNGYKVKFFDSYPTQSGKKNNLALKIKIMMCLLMGTVTMALMNHPQLTFFITLPVFIWCGLPFITHIHKMSMDTLIGVGTLVTYLFSAVATFFPHFFQIHGQNPDVYYEITLFLLGFILLGKFLESKSQQSTLFAVHQLMHLVPATARVIEKNLEKTIPVQDLNLNQVIKVLPGERIPVDGILQEGLTTIDESLFTGESVPVDKKAGDKVFSGSLNITGMIKINITHLKNQTLLSQIIELVKKAQSSKPKIQRIADQVCSFFVPTILIISIITFLIWWIKTQSISTSLIFAVSVLVIACPCAIGLATPTAITVGIGKAAQKGILIRSAEVIEKLHQAKIFVFDKTGTLTKGIPTINYFQPIESKDSKNVLKILASAESGSEHPYALAIIEKAKEQNLDLQSPKWLKSFHGKGIHSKVNDEIITIGKSGFLEENKISIPSFFHSKANELCKQGVTPLFAAINNQFIALLGVSDSLREDAFSVIQKLKEKKLKTFLLSGDKNEIVSTLAKNLGIDEYYSEKLPHDKERILNDLRTSDPIIMIGDGINDAPSLAAADVGIAMGSGTDIASEASDLILINNKLTHIIDVIHISQKTFKIIKQNLLASFVFNTLGIPIAAGIFYPMLGWKLTPELAGGAMALSSILVVLNSLRLKKLSI